MSYAGTAAQSGFGSTLWVYTTSGTPSLTAAPPATSWTAIGEATGAKQSGLTNKTEDATNFQSTAEEFIATILSSGSYQFDVNRVTADAGQVQLSTNFQAKSLNWYAIMLPLGVGQTTHGDVYFFRALVEQYPKTIEPTKIIRFSCTLKLSGAETFLAGA
jgi:hypothetical protein